jgi:hypothetical protein
MVGKVVGESEMKCSFIAPARDVLQKLSERVWFERQARLRWRLAIVQLGTSSTGTEWSFNSSQLACV